MAKDGKSKQKALEAFKARQVGGLNLSDRVWRYTDMFKDNIEAVLDAGLREGMSAPEMATKLKQYLKYPDKLFRRVRGKDGKLHLSRPAKNFHPGRGVYRSSYMNALRLSATENNIAYRTSDYLRIQNFDFVVGIEVKLSNNHTLKNPQGGAPIPLHDICDELKGRYPKDFKFTGWHPLCRCHAETILKTREEMNEDMKRILDGKEPSGDSVNTVRDVPEAFKGWIERNGERIAGAKNPPYFIRDNAKYAGAKFSKTAKAQIDGAAPKAPQKTAKEIAGERHANRTPEQIKETRMKWFMRDMTDNIPEADKKKIAENWLEIEKMSGVKKGGRMSVDDADMQKANPNYGGKGFDINCATCAPCYALREAGFDFKAKANIPANTLNEWMSCGNSFKVWKKTDGTEAFPTTYCDWLSAKVYKQMSPNRWTEFFSENCTEDGIYVVTIGWQGGGGHATIVRKFKDGSISYIEPQHYIKSLGVKRSIDDLVKYASLKQPLGYGIMRVDNKIFDTSYLSIFEK